MEVRQSNMRNPVLISDTFWSKKRIENNLSIKDLGEMIGASYTQTSKYLTGQQIPPEPMLKKLCDLFDVNYDVGLTEANIAHANWSPRLPKSGKKKISKPSERFTKDTFWNRQRLAKHMTLKKLAKELDSDIGYLSKCLSGAVLPSTPHAAKICDYFGIEYTIGATEFNKAHEQWIAEHPGKKKHRNAIHSRKYSNSAVKPTIEVNAPNSSDTSVPEIPDVTDAILDKLYGKIPVDDFNLILAKADPNIDVLSITYGNVDRATYQEIYKLVKG